jgi:hypothetical protein
MREIRLLHGRLPRKGGGLTGMPQIGRVLREMRTGYSRLNKYRNNTGLASYGKCPVLLMNSSKNVNFF